MKPFKILRGFFPPFKTKLSLSPSEYRGRPLPKITQVLIHRIEVGATAEETKQFFEKDRPKWSGGKTPYHFLIQESGRIEQMVRLSQIGPHAKKYNSSSIAIALVGDFRKKEPSKEQMKSLKLLATELMYHLSIKKLWGHDELKGSSSDPNKKCPGKHIDMDDLRDTVEMLLRAKQRKELTRLSISI